MYNTIKIPGIGWNLPIVQKDKNRSNTDVPFSQPSCSLTSKYFSSKYELPASFNPFPLYWDSKTFPIVTVLLLGLKEYILHCLWLQKIFKWSTAWNIIFYNNVICILVFTCNLYICFTYFVGVSTCIVRFLLSVYIPQLFKKILDSIQGLMLFFIFLAQLNYFFSKTFKLILQSATI